MNGTGRMLLPLVRRRVELVEGQVLGGGAPVVNSRVTLYAATAGEPKQLAQTKTDNQLADLLSACVTRLTPKACSSLFAAATPPGWGALTDTVNTPEVIALYPWYQPERLYALLLFHGQLGSNVTYAES